MTIWRNYFYIMSVQIPNNILHFEHLLSTNTKLKALKANVPEFTIVITDKQTAGKGQAGNYWESEANKNLTFSLLLKPIYIEIQDQFIISKAVALGIIHVFKDFSQDFSIKWPNDIYYRDKKIGGILIENTISRTTISDSIVGIGLNINQEYFTSDAPNPISLKNISGQDFELITILSKVVHAITAYVNDIKCGNSAKLNQLYLNNLYRRQGFHLYKDHHGEFMAQITGINEYGHLQLKTQTGEKRTYAFKEVTFIIH
ncbi:bifunctional protein BirA [Saccharicrinis fermentans DSM 9555 = JCM 21142]|uniref:Bifunctional protein BirA n=2 Tax=Saccharicrinis fermentans TaxID=982 RepID=W7XUH8_9BACT|nr:bifunctional protein BirA [Saccharicrinis fermentans DSM 9555 = JCM 21142]